MKTLLLAAGLAVLSVPASAASISVTSFDATTYANVVSGYGNAVTENFESFIEGNVDDGFATSVGTFATLGGTGSGGTVSNADFANDGSKLAVRDGNVYGRTSTTARLTDDKSDDKFLDSNDTYGISWMVSLGGSMFDSLVLTLTDATDVGATMLISVGDKSYSFAGLGDANKQTVRIDFDQAVDTASIFFGNWRNGSPRLNDGFSIDDIAVSEVPLPASALLLLAGLAGLASTRRKSA